MKFDLKLTWIICVVLVAAHPEHGHYEELYHLKEVANILCLPHCSYICLATAGNIESCEKLMLLGNETMANLPTMETCPSTTGTIEECFAKCRCQCTRCAICLKKSLMNGSAADCHKSDNKLECMKEAKAVALQKCN